MARPRQENPTPAEFEVLQVVWEKGASTVREVMEVLNEKRPRAYTSVMSLMNVMAKKGLLTQGPQEPQGRAFVYAAKLTREKTRSKMLKELLGRTFGGSTKALMIQILQDTQADAEELEEIRETIAEYEKNMNEK